MIPIEQCIITKEKFDAFVQQCIKMVMKVEFSDKPESIMPKLFIRVMDPETGKEGLIIAAIATDFNEWEEKSAALYKIGQEVAKDKHITTAVALMSECWMSRAVKDGKQMYSQPRYDPDKKEAVTLAAMDMSANYNAMWVQIVRREDGRMVTGELHQTEGATMKSPLLRCFFDGFFGEKPVKKGR